MDIFKGIILGLFGLLNRAALFGLSFFDFLTSGPLSGNPLCGIGYCLFSLLPIYCRSLMTNIYLQMYFERWLLVFCIYTYLHIYIYRNTDIGIFRYPFSNDLRFVPILISTPHLIFSQKFWHLFPVGGKWWPGGISKNWPCFFQHVKKECWGTFCVFLASCVFVTQILPNFSPKHALAIPVILIRIIQNGGI